MNLSADTEYKQFLVNSLVRFFPDVDFHLLAMTAFSVMREREAGEITVEFVERVRMKLKDAEHVTSQWRPTPSLLTAS